MEVSITVNTVAPKITERTTITASIDVMGDCIRWGIIVRELILAAVSNAKAKAEESEDTADDALREEANRELSNATLNTD